MCILLQLILMFLSSETPHYAGNRNSLKMCKVIGKPTRDLIYPQIIEKMDELHMDNQKSVQGVVSLFEKVLRMALPLVSEISFTGYAC